MLRVTLTRRSALSAVAATLVGGCAVSPVGANGQTYPPVSSSSPVPTATVSAAPSTPGSTASTTAAPAGGSLLAGTNHATRATPNVYKAADVHRWLVKGKTEADYPTKKVAFLTFDDGPNNVMTGSMLDALKALQVPATFFYVCNKTALGAANPLVVQRTLAEGHAIDVHSFSHDYKYLYPGRNGNVTNIMADLDKALAAIRGVVGQGYQVHGFRYPGGHMSWKGLAAADAALANRNMWWLDWNCMSGDADKAAPKTTEGMVAMLRNTLKASGDPNVAVMLNHDSSGASLTKASLPAMVGFLRERGYSFGVID